MEGELPEWLHDNYTHLWVKTKGCFTSIRPLRSSGFPSCAHRRSVLHVYGRGARPCALRGDKFLRQGDDSRIAADLVSCLILESAGSVMGWLVTRPGEISVRFRSPPSRSERRRHPVVAYVMAKGGKAGAASEIVTLGLGPALHRHWIRSATG